MIEPLMRTFISGFILGFMLAAIIWFSYDLGNRGARGDD